MNDLTRRTPRHAAWRLLGWVAALAIIAFAVTFGVGHVEASNARASALIGVSRDPAVGFGHHHATDTLEVRSFHVQASSRSRTWVLAVLAVGVVVVALARRELLLREYAVAPQSRLTGLRSGRDPPLARIA